MQISREFYVEKIDGSCVRLEPFIGVSQCAGAGAGMSGVIVETHEATPISAFWGSVASCGRFEVIIRKKS